jgi:hypothetical protein
MAGERATRDNADDMLRTMRTLEGSYTSSREGVFVNI